MKMEERIESRVVVRPATPADAEVIARIVALAIGDPAVLCHYCGEDHLAVLTEVARREATQYSWQAALIAEVDGRIAGGVVGYDGALLRHLREGTFAVLRERVGRLPELSDETQAGEYYLDSIAVFSEFRGQGVGQALLRALCARAAAEGHARVGLLVDQANPRAERLYRSMGFERIGRSLFFNHPMWHLQRASGIG